MAPLSLFRGQGGTTNTSLNASAVSMAVDPLPPPEPPRTPPPLDALRRSSSGGEPTPSPSRLNPARLLRRRGSRSAREPREGRDGEGWFGALRGQSQSQSQPQSQSNSQPQSQTSSAASMTVPTTASFDRVGGSRQSGSSVRSDGAQIRPSPSRGGRGHHSSASISTSAPTTSHSRQGSAGSSSAVPNAVANSSASNFGSVRSMRSIRSDGASTHGDTEIILGPSPDHPLIKGEPSVVHHHPFLLPASAASGSSSCGFSTPLSPPRRPPRSPIPPPPPPRATPAPHVDSRASTPSSGSQYSDVGDSGQSATATVRPADTHADPADMSIWRADTAAWLARRPSGRRPAPLASVVDGRRRAESAGSYATPSVSGTSASGESADEPLTPTVSPRIGGIPATPTSAQPRYHHQHTLSAMASPSPRRPSPPPPQPHPSASTLAQAPVAPRTPDHRLGYVVSVQCLPAADGEVRWEVVLRRAPVDGGFEAEGLAALPSPGGPVLLAPGTHAQSVSAPPFASSVNLSLALDTDSPSGKLQFITLPGGTPTRIRPRSVSQSAASGMPTSPRSSLRQSHSSHPSHSSQSSFSSQQSPHSTLQSLQFSPPPFIPRDSVFGPSLFGSAFGGALALGPPAPLSLSPPDAESSSPPATDITTPRSPRSQEQAQAQGLAQAHAHSLSPRSPAYKRQGAVWAASGGFSPLTGAGEDVFIANPHLPSPRAARGPTKVVPATSHALAQIQAQTQAQAQGSQAGPGRAALELEGATERVNGSANGSGNGSANGDADARPSLDGLVGKVQLA